MVDTSQPQSSEAVFEQVSDVRTDAMTLIEGLPGHGLVASIAVDQITRQLDLSHHGNIVSDRFPPVTSFKDGRIRNTVRIYAGEDPPVMTLQSDVALPQEAFGPLSKCLLEDLSAEFERAIFLAGAPAESEEQIGDVFGIATSDELIDALLKADIDLAEGPGLISGITGALATASYQADVPAAVLIVKANPYLPDPEASRAVIENALEPLVDFDIDTTELHEQAQQIQAQMEQIAQQYRQAMQGETQAPREIGTGMYQ